MRSRRDRATRFLTSALVGVGALGVELTLATPGSAAWRPWATGLGLWALAEAAAWVVARQVLMRERDPLSRPEMRRLANLGAAVLLLGPVAWAVARWAATRAGTPLELILIAGLRNLALGLLTMATASPGLRRLSALLSLFLVLVTLSLAEGAAPLALAVTYAALACPWLMIDHAARLAQKPGNTRFPLRAAVLVSGCVVLAVALTAFGPHTVITTLAGFLPSSGGTEEASEEARGGVDDGPNEIDATRDPRSIGFTESELFLESDRPSLYDAFNEQYGEPRKNRQQDRAVALAADRIRELPREAPEDFRAGQSFSTRRSPLRPPDSQRLDRPPVNLASHRGTTPAHLPLATFASLQGDDWIAEPACELACPLAAEPGSPWMRLELPIRPAIHAEAAHHRVKMGRLDSAVLPLPPHVCRFRAGTLNQSDFFRWAQPGLLRVVARGVPTGTMVESQALTVDPELVRAIEFPTMASTANDVYMTCADAIPGESLTLLDRWIAGIPRGWLQIEAVIAGLRSEFTLAAPDGDGVRDAPDLSPLRRFLLRDRRGPDYLFASAAALFLRHLGYPTRLVSGLYVPPGRADRRTRETALTARDLHFWVEVQLPGGTWLTVEPTPGYSVAPPIRPWWHPLRIAASGAAAFTQRHAGPLTVLLATLLVAWRFRAGLADALATALWRMRLRRVGPEAETILGAYRIIAERSRRAGCGRRRDQTPTRWWRELAASSVPIAHDPDVPRLVPLWERLLYAPSSRDSAPASGDRAALARSLDRVVAAWSHRALRHAAGDASARPAPVPGANP